MNRDLPTARRWLPLLLAAMLFAQALGLVHRVLHAPTNGAVVAQVHDDAFDHDEGDAQCRLYDQLAQGDLACGAGATFAAQPAPHTPDAMPPAGRLAAQASGYLARGPPLLTA